MMTRENKKNNNNTQNHTSVHSHTHTVQKKKANQEDMALNTCSYRC